MFNHVLVAIDGSPTSNRALKAAIGLAADQRASLSILHVVDSLAGVAYVGDMTFMPATYVDEVIEDLRNAGRRILAKAEAAAREAGIGARTLLVESVGGSIAVAILAQVRRLRADLIVMGTHGRQGVQRAVFGSDAEAVVRESRVPVLLVRALRSAKPRGRGSADAPASTGGGRDPEVSESKPRSRKGGR